MTTTGPTRPPVWLLDVDGVINVRRSPWHAAPHNGVAFSGGMGWKMRWAPQLIARIRALHRAGAAEIRWCTSWCAEADQRERLFKLPAFGRAFTDEAPSDGVKLAAARAVLADGRRLIWTDDAEVPVPQEQPELYTELTTGGRALLIRPRERTGLGPEHLDRIESFARAEAGPVR